MSLHPSSWQKLAEFKRNLSEWERKKIHKEQSLQILRFIADFPLLQSCQTATVPEGDYLHKPLGLSPCASSDNMMTRDLCVAACCLQNSWRQNPSFQILNLWQDLGSDIFWYDLLSASNKTKQNSGGILWGMLLFLSLVPCARSCYWVEFTQSHQHEIVQFFLFPLPHQSDIVCLVLWGKGSLPSLPTMLLPYQHY